MKWFWTSVTDALKNNVHFCLCKQEEQRIPKKTQNIIFQRTRTFPKHGTRGSSQDPLSGGHFFKFMKNWLIQNLKFHDQNKNFLAWVVDRSVHCHPPLAEHWVQQNHVSLDSIWHNKKFYVTTSLDTTKLFMHFDESWSSNNDKFFF